MNTEALRGKIGFLEGSHSSLWQGPVKHCQLGFLSLHNLYPFSLWMLALMSFPSPPFTKADTDDGFVVDFIYVHSCPLLFYCGLDVRFHLHT